MDAVRPVNRLRSYNRAILVRIEHPGHLPMRLGGDTQSHTVIWGTTPRNLLKLERM